MIPLMPSIRHTVLAFALLAGSGGVIPVSAQTLGVRTLALGAGQMPELYLRGEDEYHELEFSAVQPGEVIPALDDNPLILFKKAENEAGEVVFEPVHRVGIPSGAKGVLLLGWTSGDEFRQVALEDHFRGARFNDWLLINTSAKPVAFKVGKDAEPVLIKPGASVTHRIRAKAGKGVSILAQAPFDGEAKTFYSTFWPVRPGKRAVVLFYDDGERVRIKRISDQLEPAEEP